MDVRIKKGTALYGEIDLPTSKSQTLRALFSAMLAKGISIIDDALESEDTEAMLGAIKAFGVQVFKKEKRLIIHSPGFSKLRAPQNIHVYDSGITLRFMAAFAALFNTSVLFTGSKQLSMQRSMKDLEDGLKRLKVKVTSENGFCPFRVHGPLRKRSTVLKGHDSQPVSALLWLLSLSNKKGILHVTDAKERPWINLTKSWLVNQKTLLRTKNFKTFCLHGKGFIRSFKYTVPKDFSSSLFIIAAGLLNADKVTIKNLDFQDLQGDKAVIFLLKKAGANITFSKNELTIQKTEKLNLTKIDIDPFIDALPVLSVLSLISQSNVQILNAQGARGKESDRITCMRKNLSDIGAKIEEDRDGLSIIPSKISGGECASFNDHRIAMSCVLTGLISDNEVLVKNAECVKKTYPEFFNHLKKLGALIEI